MAPRAIARHKASLLTAAMLLLFCSGCTSVSDDGTTAKFGYSAAVPLCVALVGLGIAGYGFFKMTRGEEGGGVAQGLMTMVGGGVVVLFVAPAFAMAHVTVSPDKTVIGGSMIWFIPSSTVIDYTKVSSMKTEVTERWTKRGKRKSETLVITFNDGKTERMSQTALIDAALPRIVSSIENRNRGGGGVAGGMAGMGGLPQNPVMPNAANALLANNPLPNNPAITNPAVVNSAVAQSQANPPGQPVTDVSKLQPGMTVSGQAKDGAWYNSKIVQVLPDGTVKIHYEGYADSFDEVVPFTRVRITNAAPNGIAGVPPSNLPTAGFPMPPGNFPPPPSRFPRPPVGFPNRPGFPPTGNSIPANTVDATTANVKQGLAAQALWGGKWYPIKILEVQAGGNLLKIHYDGYADSFDEVVPLSKVRVPK